MFTQPRKLSAIVPAHAPELTSIPSVEASRQTNGYPYALMLAFDNPDAAERAYELFEEDGTTPAHGRGPWVIFIGRTPRVFTS